MVLIFHTLKTDKAVAARQLYTLAISLILFGHCVFAQSSSDIQSYISQYKQIALEQESSYGIPAPITLAQGILESGAGKSALTVNANNHFGIKAYGGWTGRIYLEWDDETVKSKFRWYDSAEESYRDHSLFLTNNERYKSLFSKSIYDYRGWANGLQKAGYATSPTYAKALIGYIDAYKLYAINGGVKLRPGKTVIITRNREELAQQTDLQYAEDEESEEEEEISNITQHYVPEINNVRCTMLCSGESLSSISRKYDIPKAQLLDYNEATDEAVFKEGDIVYLEKKKKKYSGAKDFYWVQSGDTLYGISQQYGIKLACLAKMNKKSEDTVLYEGEKIRLK